MLLRILTIVLAVTCAGAHAADPDVRPLSTNGTSTIQVTPDQMLWQVQVQNLDPADAGQSAAQHQQEVAAVLKALKKLGIDEDSLQTTGMRLGKKWDTRNRDRVFLGYEATTLVSFTLEDFSRYADTWITLAGFPEVAILGVQLDSSQRIRYRNEARVEAVKAARQKALDMAEALGVKLGPPLEVEEVMDPIMSPRLEVAALSNSMISVGGAGSQEQNFAPGKIPVTVRVRCVFELDVE